MRTVITVLWLNFAGSRPYIFLSGRVHPGESNSSWVMKGENSVLKCVHMCVCVCVCACAWYLCE